MTTAELGKGLIVRLLHSLVQSLPTASGAGLVLIDSQHEWRLVAAVGAAEEWLRVQLECGCGPLAEAALKDEVKVLDPFDPEDYPGLVPPARAERPAALVVLPGAWAGEGRLATTLCLDAPPDAHVVTAMGEYEPLLAHALGLLEYCGDAEMRADQMLQMTQYRRVIEQAKGMVMTRRSVGADEAFARLADVSQRHNVRLRELAVALVEGVGGSPAEQPIDQGAQIRPSPEAVQAASRLWDDLGT